MRLLLSLLQMQLLGTGILMSSAMSCGSFQYAGLNNDDIYDDRTTEVVYNQGVNKEKASPEVEENDNNDGYYTTQLKELAASYDNESDIITNVDDYSSGYYDENAESQNNYGGWGQESDEVNVTIYHNFGYSPYWRPYYYRPWNWSVGFGNWSYYYGYNYWGPGYYPYEPWYNPYFYGGYYGYPYGHPYYSYPHYGNYYNNGYYRGGSDVVLVNGHRGGRGASNTGLLSASSRESFQRTMNRSTRGTKSTSLNTRPTSSLLNSGERPSRGDYNSRPVESSRPSNSSRPDASRPSSSQPNATRPVNSSRPTRVRPNNSSRPTSSPRINQSSSRRTIKDSPASASNTRPMESTRPVSSYVTSPNSRSSSNNSTVNYSRSNNSSGNTASRTTSSSSGENSSSSRRRGNN